MSTMFIFRLRAAASTIPFPGLRKAKQITEIVFNIKIPPTSRVPPRLKASISVRQIRLVLVSVEHLSVLEYNRRVYILL